MRTLLIDNYDSFTYNLFHLLGRVGGEPPTVLRNDDRLGLSALDPADFDAIVVSPGPGTPARERDFGLSRWAVTQTGLPVLGVCLGHQGMWLADGARVGRAPQPVHGRVSEVFHDGDPLFDGIPSPFRAVRYHSLAVTDLPADVLPTAHTADGVLMAARHARQRRWGVQFHPESVATRHGERLLANFRDLVGAPRRTAAPAPPVVRSDPGLPAASGPAQWSLSVRAVPGGVADPAAAFAALFGAESTAFWLDSSLVTPGRGRFSVLGDAAGPFAEVLSYDVHSRTVTVAGRSGVRRVSGDLFAYLRGELIARAVPESGLPCGFDLGYVGALGYELKADCGAQAGPRAAQPDANLIFADRALVIDHRDGAAWLLALTTPEHPADAWFAATLHALATLHPLDERDLPPLEDHPVLDEGEGLPVLSRHSPGRYATLIARCQQAIAAGESYELTLTNALTVPVRRDPWRLYRVLRRVNPAPYAAYLRFPDFSVLSSSPERFLRVDAAGQVESKPIKGTRPRGATPVQDARLATDLRTDVKERAENLMIVDLVRNDLGRVAELGSVRVPVLFGVESYQTVHQLVSTVTARLGPGVHPVDCVRAAFPGGSMTGAPKLRTMELLDAWEGGPRGVYSGALGYFSLSGAVDLSIVIRALVVTDSEVSIGVGGAITALSDPTAEIDETRVKARALLRAVALAGDPVPADRAGLAAPSRLAR